MHMLECEAYLDIRADFADVFDVPFNDNRDAYMMQIMNRGPDTHAWNRLANFLINVMARRKAIIEGL